MKENEQAIHRRNPNGQKPKNWSIESLIKEISIKIMRYHFLLLIWKTFKRVTYFAELPHEPIAVRTIN